MIRLEYFNENDFDLLLSWIESPEFLLQWSGSQFSFPLNRSQLLEYISNSNEEGSSQYSFKAVSTDTGETIGHISLGKIDRKHESARIRKVLVSKSLRGKGTGTEMVQQVLNIAFQDLKLNRVSLGVFDFNIGAIQCYEKIGFKKEGLLRETIKINNEYWNMYEMSILKSEWKQGKAN